MLDWIWVSRVLPLLCHVVNFVGGEVQQWCTGGTSNWDGVISRLPKRMVHRISCYLMRDARSVPREVRTFDDWRTKKKMAIECIRMMGKNNRWQSCASE
jgi:hypothetical protein